MSPEDRRLVTTSFARIFAAKGRVAQIVYDELFRRHPAIRPLFPDDLGKQQEKLNATLATMVRQISDPAEFHELIDAMGRRHVAYGARPEHLPILGSVLIHALGDAAPGGLSAPETAAWEKIYGKICDIMAPAMEEEMATRSSRRVNLPGHRVPRQA